MKPRIDLVRGAGPVGPANEVKRAAAAVKPRAFSLELTKGCNLRCGYCYYAAREDAYDAKTRMSAATAEQSVELLLREAAPGEPVHLHLFGGEPLMNLALVRHVVEYGVRRAREAGRAITFELTTNGTRFKDDTIAFLNEHAIHVGVSFDGPPDIQDAARPAFGRSSWELATPGIRAFLDSRRATDLARKTHCSVVVTRRELDLVRIVEHLEGLGFERIILTPATDLTGKTHGIRPEDLPELLRGYDALAALCERRKRAGRPVGITWFDTLMGRLLSGERTTKFCEGGRDYLGVAADGSVALCYRFYENAEFSMGDVRTGIDRGVTERLLDLPLESKPACSQCWARYFCGGGCHHENLIATGGLGDPNPVTCEIMRHSMDLTLDSWARLSRDGLIEACASVASGGRTDMSTEDRAPRLAMTDRPKVRASCHVRAVGDEHVVYEPVSHEVVVLNPTAHLVFSLCDGERTVEALLTELEQRFAAPVEVLRRDLVDTLGHFRQKGLLEG